MAVGGDVTMGSAEMSIVLEPRVAYVSNFETSSSILGMSSGMRNGFEMTSSCFFLFFFLFTESVTT